MSVSLSIMVYVYKECDEYICKHFFQMFDSKTIKYMHYEWLWNQMSNEIFLINESFIDDK